MSLLGLQDHLVSHAYALVLLWVFLEQVGLPLPSGPVLLIAGRMVLLGRLNLSVTMICIMLGCMMGDSAWFMLGRRYGDGIQRRLPKMTHSMSRLLSSETNNLWRESLTIFLSKFIPGAGTLVPTMLALRGRSLSRFLLTDIFASLGWAIVWMTAGRVPKDMLHRLVQSFNSHWLAATMTLGLSLLGWACARTLNLVTRRRHYDNMVGETARALA